MALVSKELKTLPVGDHRDSQGLMLRVNKNGSRTWTLAYAQGPKRRKMKLGEYPGMTLSEARQRTAEVRMALHRGEDPQAAAEGVPTVSEAVELYLSHLKVKKKRNGAGMSPRYIEEQRRALLLLTEAHGHRKITELTAVHVDAVVTPHEKAGRQARASALFRYYSAFLSFCRARPQRWIKENVLIGEEGPVQPRARERVLSDQEVSDILNCGDKTAIMLLVRLLFYTCARRTEVANMKWSDIDFERCEWTIEDTKNDNVLVVPLVPAVMALLSTLPRDGEYVVGNKDTAFSGFSKAKRRIDQLSGVSDWRLHDIRRTCTTMMSKLGIPAHVRKALLNHSEGGVHGIYDRYDLMIERREALDALSRHLSGQNQITSAAS